MAKKGNRKHIVLKSKDGHTYHSTKNRKNSPDRLELVKYNPKTRQHEVYKEEK